MINMKKTSPPSNRDFGLLLTLVFGILSALAFYEGGVKSKSQIYSIITIVVASITFLVPNWLSPFNKGWMKLGDLMGKIVSPLVLGFIFFILITPIALLSRMFGRDELRLNKITDESYWIDRPAQSQKPESFKNQF